MKFYIVVNNAGDGFFYLYSEEGAFLASKSGGERAKFNLQSDSGIEHFFRDLTKRGKKALFDTLLNLSGEEVDAETKDVPESIREVCKKESYVAVQYGVNEKFYEDFVGNYISDNVFVLFFLAAVALLLFSIMPI